MRGAGEGGSTGEALLHAKPSASTPPLVMRTPLPLHLIQAYLACEASKPQEQVDATLMQEDIHQLLDELPAQEAELLRLRYGIAAGEALSLSATARQMGITRDTARGLERRANASIRRLSTRFMDHLEA